MSHSFWVDLAHFELRSHSSEAADLDRSATRTSESLSSSVERGGINFWLISVMLKLSRPSVCRL